jgi:peptidyl-prolyl cis-trans isomerase A (cyclophilin A)
MIGRLLAFLALILLGAPLAAQPPAAPPATARVLLHTSVGDIIVALETQRAPITAGNFLHYVDTHRLDGQEFYRAMHTGPDAGLIQGGVRDGRLLFPPIAHEPTSQTGLSHDDGALSMPRLAVGTARADFTIMVGPQHYLDAGPGSAGDGLGYAVFGHVVQGMDSSTAFSTRPPRRPKGRG